MCGCVTHAYFAASRVSHSDPYINHPAPLTQGRDPSMDPYTLSKSRWRSFSKTSQRYNLNDCPCCWGYQYKRKRVAFKRDFADGLEREYRIGRSRYSTTSAYVFLNYFWEGGYKWGEYSEDEDPVTSSDLATDTEQEGPFVSERLKIDQGEEQSLSTTEEGWELVSNGTVMAEDMEDWENINEWES
jgi:hypothetical protein